LKHEAIVILATLLSDHSVFMQDGEIACEGTPKGLKEEYGEMYQLRLLVNESAVSDLKHLIKKALSFLSATHVAQGNYKLNFEPRHIQAVTAFLKWAVNLRDSWAYCAATNWSRSQSTGWSAPSCLILPE
jgi:ABC-type multidrug transport system ATPase subunit